MYVQLQSNIARQVCFGLLGDHVIPCCFAFSCESSSEQISIDKNPLAAVNVLNLSATGLLLKPNLSTP